MLTTILVTAMPNSHNIFNKVICYLMFFWIIIFYKQLKKLSKETGYFFSFFLFNNAIILPPKQIIFASIGVLGIIIIIILLIYEPCKRQAINIKDYDRDPINTSEQDIELLNVRFFSQIIFLKNFLLKNSKLFFLFYKPYLQ